MSANIPCRRCSKPTRARPVGEIRRAGQGHRIDRPGRDRPGRADRHDADRADELDVAPERILLRTGDTDLTPNEGYTAGSQSIQYGGVGAAPCLRRMRDCCSTKPPRARPSARRAGGQRRRDRPAGRADRAGLLVAGAGIDLSHRATAGAAPKSARSEIGRNTPRVDLAGKVFGAPSFVHDMVADGMCMRASCASRAPAQPSPRSTRRRSAAPPRARSTSSAMAISSRSSARRDRGRRCHRGRFRPCRVDGIDLINPAQEEARWLLQRPSIDRVLARRCPIPRPPGAPRSEFHPHAHRHASVGPSSALAVYKDGHLTVCRIPRASTRCARRWRGLEARPCAYIGQARAGPGCYGHNGADDAAADAAVIAMRRPGAPIRVRWRREEEFGSSRSARRW